VEKPNDINALSRSFSALRRAASAAPCMMVRCLTRADAPGGASIGSLELRLSARAFAAARAFKAASCRSARPSEAVKLSKRLSSTSSPLMMVACKLSTLRVANAADLANAIAPSSGVTPSRKLLTRSRYRLAFPLCPSTPGREKSELVARARPLFGLIAASPPGRRDLIRSSPLALRALNGRMILNIRRAIDRRQPRISPGRPGQRAALPRPSPRRSCNVHMKPPSSLRCRCPPVGPLVARGPRSRASTP
jgi:hypothetical protein